MAELRDLEEFFVFGKYLNITRSAQVLNMSHSNLSKHIKRLEQELGIDLVERDGAKVSLTPAGSVYFNGIGKILEDYDAVVEKCTAVMQDPTVMLTVQEPPYPDAAGSAYYRLIDSITKGRDNVTVTYVRAYRRTRQETIAEGTVDITQLYSFLEREDCEARLKGRGLVTRHLGCVPMGLWFSKDHRLAQRDYIDIQELQNIPVMTPNEPETPLRKPFVDICKAGGFEPKLRYLSASTKIVFYHQPLEDGAFLP